MRRSADFARTMRGGRAARGPLLLVHVLPAAEGADPAAPALVGIAVSRAVGDAVTRHRVQRRLRHLLAARLTLLQPGSRVVVRATPAAADAAYVELAADLDRQLARSGRAARTRVG